MIIGEGRNAVRSRVQTDLGERLRPGLLV